MFADLMMEGGNDLALAHVTVLHGLSSLWNHGRHVQAPDHWAARARTLRMVLTPHQKGVVVARLVRSSLLMAALTWRAAMSRSSAAAFPAASALPSYAAAKAAACPSLSA